MEDRPEIEWWFIVAETLSMTVEECQMKMGHLEFTQWVAYLARKAQYQNKS